jgi:Zn ribbon nucleic-acid-binding protein
MELYILNLRCEACNHQISLNLSKGSTIKDFQCQCGHTSPNRELPQAIYHRLCSICGEPKYDRGLA